MSDFKDLYRNSIVDHYKMPRNHHAIEHANRHANGHNPLCGDKMSVFISVKDNILTEIGFTGDGCAIAISSASMMTENLKGRTESEARRVFSQFTDLLTGSTGFSNAESLGNLSVFKDVREYPARVKCALLAWHTLLAALDKKQGTVETE